MQQFLEACVRFSIYTVPEEVKLPAPRGPPVQLIPPPVDGFACMLHSDCHYAVKDLHTLQRHCRQIHGRSAPLPEGSYRPCQVQQLFTGIGHAYFEIDADLQSSAVQPDLRTSLKKMVQTIHSSAIVPPDTERERTPLIRCMDWDTFMPNLRMDPKKRHAVQLLTQKHTPEEHDGIFPPLVQAVQLHFDKAASIINGIPSKMAYAQTLVHGANIPREG